MQKRKKSKTTGATWLYHSMAAFNGSGYADKTDAETFLASYMVYNQLKNRFHAIEIVGSYPEQALEYAEHLAAASEPGRKPTSRFYDKFVKVYGRNIH